MPYFKSSFYQLGSANPTNASVLCDFLSAEYNESNFKPSTKSAHFKIKCLFNFKGPNYRDFRDITKYDITAYLNSLRQNQTILRINGLVHTTHDKQSYANFSDGCTTKTNQIKKKSDSSLHTGE